MEKRQVFFSFHYFRDNWRAAQVKNMGVVDNSSTWSANDWEEVRYKTDEKIDKDSHFDLANKKKKCMKYPLSKLSDCNLTHYQLQLSLYAWMLQ